MTQTIFRRDQVINPTNLGLSADDIDFSHDGTQRKTMTGNTTFTISNPIYDKVILFVLDGAFTPTFPTELKIISGTYDSSKTNYIYIHCESTVAQGGSLVYAATISQPQ